jgi:hypothetical protein
MRRSASFPLASAFAVTLALTLAACPADKPKPVAVVDTTPLNLDSVKTAIPPAAPDTFKPKPMQVPIPPAPPALLEAVEREQSFSKFCYQEFGQKADPGLAGGVAMVVTVEASGITDARVRADSWSSNAGKAVNNCLNEKAALAWKPEPGAVKPGRYIVQLRFRPS